MDYKTPKWQRKRNVILIRDKYWCRNCKRYGRNREATTVHHIVPAEYFPELSFEDWNLVSLCSECHNEMHDRDEHRLTEKGWELLERTARKNGQSITQDMERQLQPLNKKKRRQSWTGTRY